MIKPGEIDKIAIEKGVRAKQIEKDYVISWILWGIVRNGFLNNNLIFKGGTCLKKMHFGDYRFSEDMDFTLRDDSMSDEDILENFRSVFKQVYEESRIKVQIIEDTIDNHETSGSLKFKMEYVATHGSDEIKVDVTRGEIIEFDIEHREVLNNYSDLIKEETQIHCYSLEEILIEKATALMGRTIPRDLYDFYYLTEKAGIKLRDVYIEFMRKAENKGHNPNEFMEKVIPKMKTFARDWNTSMSKQMIENELPDFKNLWRKSQVHFKELLRLVGH
ncbi:MAG: nucleotidyl transferase AbiEii/AbiGii toxin family protein [Chlorobi bacterium]|nr:nucleotidyl transferase AbiEii/AbiGii toxin family protein [Chlorobiota bacterium]